MEVTTASHPVVVRVKLGQACKACPIAPDSGEHSVNKNCQFPPTFYYENIQT